MWNIYGHGSQKMHFQYTETLLWLLKAVMYPNTVIIVLHFRPHYKREGQEAQSSVEKEFIPATLSPTAVYCQPK